MSKELTVKAARYSNHDSDVGKTTVTSYAPSYHGLAHVSTVKTLKEGSKILDNPTKGEPGGSDGLVSRVLVGT
jgi:hypothetical protein